MPFYGLANIAAPLAARVNGRHEDDAYTDACERRVMQRLIRALEIVLAIVLIGASAIIRARPTSPRKSRPLSPKSTSGRRRDGSPTSAFIHSRRNLSP